METMTEWGVRELDGQCNQRKFRNHVVVEDILDSEDIQRTYRSGQRVDLPVCERSGVLGESF